MVVQVAQTVLLAVVNEGSRRTVLVVGSLEGGYSEQPAMARAEDSHQCMGPQLRREGEGCSSCCCFADRCEFVKEN